MLSKFEKSFFNCRQYTFSSLSVPGGSGSCKKSLKPVEFQNLNMIFEISDLNLL